MATLPADRTKLALAQSNQNPQNVLGSSQNKNALTEAYDTIDLLYGSVTGLISTAQLSKIGIINAKDYNASGSTQTTTGSITVGSNILTLSRALDFANGQGINVNGKTEVDNLQITAPATVSSNVTVTLNGVAFLVAVLAGDTITQVATKIRAATYAGWTTGGATDTITFTSTSTGTRTTPVYSAGTTTSTGTMTVTTVGLADLITTISSGAGTTTLTLAASATATVTGITVAHDDTAAIQAAINNANSVGSGVILIPGGTYNISTKIYNSKPFVSIDGQGIDSTILLYSGTDIALEMTGDASPAYLSRQRLSNLTLKSKTPLTGIGLKTRLNAGFTIEKVKVDNFNINRLVSGCLVFEENNVTLNNGNINLKFELDATSMPCNLITYNNCRITSAKNQAIISSQDANQITFNQCQIEDNGTVGSGLNAIEFTGFNAIGVNQPIVFNECWLEANRGLNECYFNPFNTYGGVSFINTTSISTQITNTINVLRGDVRIFGGSFSSNIVTKNIVLGVNAAGFIATSYTTIDNQSVNMTIINGSLVSTDLRLNKHLKIISGVGIHDFYDDGSGNLIINSQNGYTYFQNGGHVVVNTLTFSAVPAAQSTNGTYFIDSADNIVKYKDSSGVIRIVDLVYRGSVAPTTGTYVAGDRMYNTAPTVVKSIDHWYCVTGGTSGTWRAIGCGTGTTAQRPTLVANDAGYQYLDTTLNVNGKLITWTGTAWVDSTGAIA